MRSSSLLLYCPFVILGQVSGVIIPRDSGVPSTSVLQTTPSLTSPPDQSYPAITPPPSVIRPAPAEWTGVHEPCEPVCVAEFPAGWSYGWQRAVATKTYTIAMAAHLLWANGTTDFKILPAKILSTLTLMPRNDEGTAVAVLHVGQGKWGTFGTTLTYPNAYTDYPLSYWWSGVLPTATADRMVCSTATTKQEMFFNSHPAYDSVDHSSRLSYPKDYLNGTNMDGQGYVFGRTPMQMLNFYEHAFPSEAGFSSCSEHRNALVTVTPVTTSEYITITRTVLVEPAVYRQSTVTESLEAPTPVGPAQSPTNSAANTIIPIPIAAHEDTSSSKSHDTPTPVLPDTMSLPPIPVAPSSILIGGTSMAISITVPSAAPQSSYIAPVNSGAQAPMQTYTPTIVIAGQTATPGQTITINNKPVTITERNGAVYATTPDQAPILLLAPAAAAAPGMAGLSGSKGGFSPANVGNDDNSLLNPAVGIAIRPIEIDLPGQAAGSSRATLTPIFARPGQHAGPAYVIAGQTIAAGGRPITLGTGATRTVMSLATDDAGEAVLDVNGIKTMLPAAVAVVSGEDGANSFAMFPVSTAMRDQTGITGRVSNSAVSKATASPSASNGQTLDIAHSSIAMHLLGVVLSLIIWLA